MIALVEGAPVSIYEHNLYDDGLEEYLPADGIIEANKFFLILANDRLFINGIVVSIAKVLLL